MNCSETGHIEAISSVATGQILRDLQQMTDFKRLVGTGTRIAERQLGHDAQSTLYVAGRASGSF